MYYPLSLLRDITFPLLISQVAVIRLPSQFIRERFLTRKASQNAFVRTSTLFEDLVIRCVRYAFANMPAGVGRVFFSKPVALPFLRWRLLRHGYLQCPGAWREYAAGEVSHNVCVRSDWILTRSRAMIASRVSGLHIDKMSSQILFSTIFMVSLQGTHLHSDSRKN
jgi:hypothetical protein